ncbi:Zn(II)2Cys6 transcription factor [Colletotrichum plurivorum]|uniref:Zn(II)2Cys6 transcription factor n=1 Tax=Colletotrichum plurivorum TaxID=2175906 RepID=A0A8H6JRL3_9PEZI|nr:Zn(II)2Cys6 transcription factor [Colletotrichum plurivorum]
MGDEEDETQRYFTRRRLTRGRGLRNTTGCVTCRRRHVKCDEKKPVCGGCERTKHTCAYVPRRSPNRRKTGESSADQTQSQDDDSCFTLPDSELVGDQSEDLGRDQDPPAEEDASTRIWPETPAREQPVVTTAAATASTTAVIEAFDVSDVQDMPNVQPTSSPHDAADANNHTGITPRTATTNGTNGSFGANLENATAIWVDLLLQDAAMQEFDFSNFSIDAEGLNLFGTSVVNSPAVRKALPVPAGKGLSPAPVHSNPYLAERTTALTEYQQFEKQAWYSAKILQISPQEHAIFQNFVRHISQWMDFFDPKRPFGTHTPQLAMHNVGLMNAILALSARHLSLNTKTSDETGRDPNEALRYYYKTLHYIQEAMQYDSYKTSLELLATSSIVSAYEMLDGSRQDWERHLKGVFWIQRSQVIHGDSAGLKQAVWWAWLCQDVWAAFREGRRPFTFWRPAKELDELDPYELAARSVYFFAQVVAFCSREDTEAGKNDPLARIAAADALKGMLENWRRHLTAEFQPLPYASSTGDAFEPIWIHPPAFAVAFQMYYCAHILLLMNTPILGGLEQYTQQRKRLMECVKKVCGIGMTLSDYPSSVMCSQCLYIAGIPLEDSKERSSVLKLLEGCRERCGWPIKPLGEELKARWESSDAG